MSGLRFRSDRGLSIIEVLITLVILAMVLVPIIQVFTSSHRIGFSAKRMVDVVVHVQSLVEAVAELDPVDFPPLTVNQESVLMDDDGRPCAGTTPNYQQVCDFFGRPKPIKDMKRSISAKRLQTGEVEVVIEVTWFAIEGEQRTEQKIVLPMLATPRTWQ